MCTAQGLCLGLKCVCVYMQEQLMAHQLQAIPFHSCTQLEPQAEPYAAAFKILHLLKVSHVTSTKDKLVKLRDSSTHKYACLRQLA